MIKVVWAVVLLIEIIKFLYDFLIPHWVTEDVALVYQGDEFEILCCVDDLTDDDVYDGLATSKAIAWLWFGFFGTLNNFREA